MLIGQAVSCATCNKDGVSYIIDKGPSLISCVTSGKSPASINRLL